MLPSSDSSSTHLTVEPGSGTVPARVNNFDLSPDGFSAKRTVTVGGTSYTITIAKNKMKDDQFLHLLNSFDPEQCNKIVNVALKLKLGQDKGVKSVTFGMKEGHIDTIKKNYSSSTIFSKTRTPKKVDHYLKKSGVGDAIKEYRDYVVERTLSVPHKEADEDEKSFEDDSSSIPSTTGRGSSAVSGKRKTSKIEETEDETYKHIFESEKKITSTTTTGKAVTSTSESEDTTESESGDVHPPLFGKDNYQDSDMTSEVDLGSTYDIFGEESTK